MKTIAFFDTKPYDRQFFDKFNQHFHIRYLEDKLSKETVVLAKGSDAVCVFVNDRIDSDVIDQLESYGIKMIALRCSGYNNVNMQAAYGRIHIFRVPVYSPYAVAEHTMALLLAINRKIHRAYNRTRDLNFSLNGLTGIDLFGKTIGIIGTGNIGRIFADICSGFGLRILAYDPYPVSGSTLDYVDLPVLFRESDIISLHCPLTSSTHHILNETSFTQMKKGVYIINTSRGALIDTAALLSALNSHIVRGAGLDVYEEEADFFFEDLSGQVLGDDRLSLLLAHPNVIVTAHQAFLTEEALSSIANITLQNFDSYFAGESSCNEICYQHN